MPAVEDHKVLPPPYEMRNGALVPFVAAVETPAPPPEAEERDASAELAKAALQTRAPYSPTEHVDPSTLLSPPPVVPQTAPEAATASQDLVDAALKQVESKDRDALVELSIKQLFPEV